MTDEQDDPNQPTKIPAAAGVATTVAVGAAVSGAGAARPGGDENLSAEIARTISRDPGEHVTCRRVQENHYRCNWWGASGTSEYDNPRMYGLVVTTHRVRKSRFLRVTRGAAGLLIEESGQN